MKPRVFPSSSSINALNNTAQTSVRRTAFKSNAEQMSPIPQQKREEATFEVIEEDTRSPQLDFDLEEN